MKPTRLLTACFSPTGATGKVAGAVAEGIAYPNEGLDLSAAVEAADIGADTLLLAAVPDKARSPWLSTATGSLRTPFLS